jgi:hypothetical protein
MPKYKLSKTGALNLYLEAISVPIPIEYTVFCEPCSSGWTIIIVDEKELPVDRVLVRYDSKVFRNKECIYHRGV